MLGPSGNGVLNKLRNSHGRLQDVPQSEALESLYEQKNTLGAFRWSSAASRDWHFFPPCLLQSRVSPITVPNC